LERPRKKLSPSDLKRGRALLTEPGAGWRIPDSDEAEPAAVAYALRERVKELNCLYGITQLAERHAESMDALLAGVVGLLPPSWQYPEVACARIELFGKTYKSEPFKLTAWRQTSAIRIEEEVVGEVAVFYMEKRPPAAEGPFLREERALIDAVAHRLGAVAARILMERELQETNRRLEVEQEALREANVALRAVLARIEEEKQEIHRSVRDNIQRIVMPILQALAVAIRPEQRKYVDLLRDNLEQIGDRWVRELSLEYRSLSPTELQICHLIRSGLTTKEIADIRGISASTVSRHREHIRRKLGVTGRRVNLATHLQAMLDGVSGSGGRQGAR
jgi:DNA-binding CsgD family transcriptional regulator